MVFEHPEAVRQQQAHDERIRRGSEQEEREAIVAWLNRQAERAYTEVLVRLAGGDGRDGLRHPLAAKVVALKHPNLAAQAVGEEG